MYALPLLAKGLPVPDALLMASSMAELPWCVSVQGRHETFAEILEKLLQKDGKQLPGKKGISLPQEQFLKLEQHAQQLTEALRDQNDSFSVALSNK